MKKQDVDKLEKLIDKYNLKSIIEGLSFIANEKAEHLRTNWQAPLLAKPWEGDAKKFDSLVEKLEN